MACLGRRSVKQRAESSLGAQSFPTGLSMLVARPGSHASHFVREFTLRGAMP